MGEDREVTVTFYMDAEISEEQYLDLMGFISGIGGYDIDVEGGW